MITHNLKEALLLADRILFFSKRPATVVYDHKVKSKRGNLKMDRRDVDNEYDSLNKKFPSILKGLSISIMEIVLNYFDKGGIVFLVLGFLSIFQLQ